MPSPVTCNVQALLDSASCFACTSPGMAQTLRVSIWASILSELSGESVTVNQLLDRGRCFACISPGEAQILRVQLLCEMNAALAGTPSPTPPVNDPVFDSLTHYWSMDEASGTRMDSKGSVNLVEHLATLTAGSGIKNNGASWPLASGAYLEAAMDLRPTQSISIWFNKSPDGNDVVFDGALDSDLALEAGHTGVLRVGTGGDGWVDSTLFSLEQWHNVVLVITPNGPDASLAWYLDGALVNSGVALTGQASGGIIDFGGFYGTLDEIAVWNIALNQANVTTIWNGGIGKFYRP